MKRRDYSTLCGPHTNGVNPRTPPFFYDWCRRCQEKKAKGLVTGNEGPIQDPNHHARRKWVSQKQLDATMAGQRRERLRNLVPVERRRAP